MTVRHLPNALSAFRLVAAPVLLVLAWTGQADAFLVLLVASFASDVLDGQIARRMNVASETGAKLDSWGDLATYGVLPFAVYWLWPELVRAEWKFVAAVLVAYLLPIAIGWIKFKRLTSYHTWGAKASAIVMGAALLVLFAGGPSWPFHAAAVLLIAEAIEELAITSVLPRWTSDVPTLFHARRIAKEA